MFIGFFIPGVRHITAYIAAINNYSFKKFAIFAYSGAFVWSITFVTLGIMLGEKWRLVGLYLSDFSFYIVLLLLIIALIIYYFYRNKRK